jgi:hypothetical protein
MKGFIIQQNIRRYHDLLQAETNEARRRMLLDLLAEEEAKLVEADADHAGSSAARNIER